ncbi:phosphoribosyltransferase family protein [Candidatus Pacebacteria bacterium]|nr:phosphoribosyltransferase family protein [Candidatus Paceibacterota bacterium]
MHNNADWKEAFASAGAFWQMNYDQPTGAHAELTSGKHSDGYINCSKLVTNPALVSDIAAGIIAQLQAHAGYQRPDWVIGPAYGAIGYAYEVARQLKTQFGFTEVQYTDEGKMQVLSRFDIAPTDTVLVIEDVTTTGGSALKTARVVEETGAKVLPMIGLIMNWSGEVEIEGYQIVSLLSEQMNVYDPADCPLCAAGSTAVRPKKHWDELAR